MGGITSAKMKAIKGLSKSPPSPTRSNKPAAFVVLPPHVPHHPLCPLRRPSDPHLTPVPSVNLLPLSLPRPYHVGTVNPPSLPPPMAVSLGVRRRNRRRRRRGRPPAGESSKKEREHTRRLPGDTTRKRAIKVWLDMYLLIVRNTHAHTRTQRRRC